MLDEPSILADLRSAYASGDLILFAGAGISAAGGLPTWPKLAEQLLTKLRKERAPSDAVAEVEHLIKTGRFIDALATIKEALGEDDFGAAVEKAVNDTGREVPEVARALATLAPRLRGVLTTSLDRLLQRAFGSQWEAFIKPAGDLAQRKRYILKLHGAMRDRNTWAFARRQYDRALFGRPELKEALETLFRASPVLFVGYGLDDEDLDQTFGAVRALSGAQPPLHFAVVPEPVPPFRRRMLQEAGLRLITYSNEDGKHLEMQALLRAIVEKGASSAQGSTPLEPGTVRIELAPRAVIGPAQILNGQAPLDRVVVEAAESIAQATIEITCDTGASTSTHRESRPLLSGSQVIDVSRARFRNLDELCEKDEGRSRVIFTAAVRAGDNLLVEEARTSLWMSRHEWLDQPETWAFIPALVTPTSDAVQILALKAAEVLRSNTPEDTPTPSGYQSGTAWRQMGGIFTAAQRDPFRITYVAEPENPVYMLGSARVHEQRVRTPDEIYKTKLATCHDLTLLFASCAEFLGIHPLVILTRGHTLFGFWTSRQEQQRYWHSRKRDRSAPFGDAWSIGNIADLRRLHERRAVEILETADAINPTKTYDDVRRAGAERIRELAADHLDIAIDVSASRQWIRPM